MISFSQIMSKHSLLLFMCKIRSLHSQEEKEKRLEDMFDADLDNTLDSRYAPKEEVPEEGAVALAGKRTQETLTGTDSIIEALDIAEAELKRISEHEVMSHSMSELSIYIYIYTL